MKVEKHFKLLGKDTTVAFYQFYSVNIYLPLLRHARHSVEGQGRHKEHSC